MTPEALDEWREHPVTRVAKAALRKSLDDQRSAAAAAWWAGRAWPEEQRLALLRAEAMWEDLFEASMDDFKEALGMTDDDTAHRV